jgi:hypothetical protein
VAAGILSEKDQHAGLAAAEVSLPGVDQQQRDSSQLSDAELIWVYYDHSKMKW